MSDIITKQAAMRERQTEPHKRCTGPCQQSKPYGAFAQNTKRDGQKTPRSICKACDNAKQAVYRAKVKADRKAFQETRGATLACERSQVEADAQAVSDESAFLVASTASQEAFLATKQEDRRCYCPKRSVCIRCSGIIDGCGVNYCRFCRLEVETLEAHQPDCLTLTIFNRINTNEKATRSSLEAANGLYGY